ncbi:hypothetical protein SAMN05216490_2031 [Mucilaginibacter mallensis]|uniref:Outer membrane protein beta-barrel domain-containing protein n=2 Tax=Mucilaginibacter mallensis TaxID=652787 RepID=A0A1H1VWI9_MUCMA|nr:hypothetical protein SAMN05216490_2031 [Mucilaginibacter mallensis]
MKMDKDKELDNIFKSGLENPDDHSAHLDDDWAAMEKMLDDNKKRPAIIYWLPILSGVAALLLILFGIWFLKPVVMHQQKPQQTVVNDQKMKDDIANHEQKNPGKSGGSTQQQAVGQQKNLTPANFTNNNSPYTRHNFINKSSINSSADGVRRDTTGVTQLPGAQNRQTGDELLAFNNQPVYDNATIAGQNIDTIDVSPKASTKAIAQNKVTIKKSFTQHPRYALTVLAASDLNGVNSLQDSKVGTNIGLLFSAGVFKKLTISTGVTYTSKPYMTGFNNYHTAYQFPTNPVSVQADCRMLDIPLNVDYQLYAKHRNKFSVGTGISSYLMLHESYDFNYAAGSSGPGYFNVPNPNKYFFSILNLQATYTRQVNSKFGVSVQPYLKLPLSNVGASQVRLQTTGVAVGLTWNINPLSKP